MGFIVFDKIKNFECYIMTLSYPMGYQLNDFEKTVFTNVGFLAIALLCVGAFIIANPLVEVKKLPTLYA